MLQILSNAMFYLQYIFFSNSRVVAGVAEPLENGVRLVLPHTFLVVVGHPLHILFVLLFPTFQPGHALTILHLLLQKQPIPVQVLAKLLQ